MFILKAVAFVIAWTIKIIFGIGLCFFLILMSPILIGGWAMDKTFGENGW
jgi:hypothetical protein